MAVEFLTEPLVRNCHAFCLLNSHGWLWMLMGLLRLFQDFRMLCVHEDFIVIAIGVACSEEHNRHRATSF